MQTKLEEAGLSGTSRTSFFASDDAARNLGWALGNYVGMICTRIQKLAQGKAGVPDEAVPGATAKAEVREYVGRLIWGYNNINRHMPDLEAKINEWCGGGYSKPGNREELEAAGKFLGLNTAQMEEADKTRRVAMRDYLTIRRAGLAPVMLTKLQTLLDSNIEEVEPTAEQIETACQRAFENRIIFGDWAGAGLAKDDMMYHLGKAPTQPAADPVAAKRAEEIRAELARKQAEQAQKDNEALIAFDALDLLDDDQEAAA